MSTRIFLLVLWALSGFGMAREIALVELASVESATQWKVVNDTVMGGRSYSRLEVDDEILRFTGVLNTNGGGFASFRSDPQSIVAADEDRIRLTVRGDGRRYQFRLYGAASGTTYQSEFKTVSGEWMSIELPLVNFRATWRGRMLNRPPPSAEDLASYGFLLADGIDGPFILEVSAVSLVSSSAP